MAAEYILKEGNEAVMLCERGIRTFETAYRFTLDLMAIPVLKELTHLPVIVDPSHAAGRRDLVLPLSLAAAAAGADGIIVEVHPNPDEAICDAAQQLVADEFADYLERVQAAAAVAGKTLSERFGRRLSVAFTGTERSDAVRDQRIERLVPLVAPARAARGAAAVRRARRGAAARPRRGPGDPRRRRRSAAGRGRAVQRPRRRCDPRLRRAPEPAGRAAARRPVRGDAGLLREAAHDDRLEGADQRPAPRRLQRRQHRACGWRGGCCWRCWRWGCRSAASSLTRSPRSTSPTRSAGGRSAPARSRARSTASSAPACRCRSASRTGPTATSRSPSTPCAPRRVATPSPGSTSTARRRSSTRAATTTAT